MNRSILNLCLALVLLTASLKAQTTKEEFLRHPDYAGGLYRPYLYEHVPLTPAPKGYIPFYISHYGRHGSRWLLSANVYQIPNGILGEAEKAGVLTALGKSLYERLRIAAEDAEVLGPELPADSPGSTGVDI